MVFVAPLIVIAFGASPTPAQEVSRTAQISPVRLTYTDLATLMGKIHEFVRVANATAKPEHTLLESMDLSGPLTSLTLKEDFSARAFAYAPPVTYSVDFIYEIYGPSDAEISSIRIVMDDWKREITVKGRAPDQVLALVAIVTESLRERETIMGGPPFRVVLPILTFIILIAIILIRFPAWDIRAVIGLGIPILGLTMMFVVPWQSWAPGTVVLAENAPFLQAHAPLFTFIGATVGVIGLLPPWHRILGRRPAPPTKATKR